ncbi:hypothetical protein HZC35_03420 [Candidatus Saganbacteria bacterium]|nr:hypothetical protein [Candidatus Saganbacteria bacterium]
MELCLDRAAIRRRITSNLRYLNSNERLHGYYEGRYVRDREELAANRVARDKVLGLPTPGMILAVGPDQFRGEVLEGIERVQQELAAEPAVFNFTPGFFHMTVQVLNPSFNTDLAGAEGEKAPYTGPDFLRGANFLRYDSVIRRLLAGMRPFEIYFQGLGMSPAAGFIQGYDRGILNSLRIDLLQTLEDEGLDFADKQPEIVHGTISSFTSPLSDPAGFTARIDALRDRELGGLTVRKISLIGVREMGRSVEVLQEFRLQV